MHDLGSELKHYLRYSSAVLGIKTVAIGPASASALEQISVQLKRLSLSLYLVDAQDELAHFPSAAMQTTAEKLKSAIESEWTRVSEGRDLLDFQVEWIKPQALETLSSDVSQYAVMVFGDLDSSRSESERANDPKPESLTLPRLSELQVSPELKRKAWQSIQAWVKSTIVDLTSS